MPTVESRDGGTLLTFQRKHVAQNVAEASRSEIVVPVWRNGEIIAVLDIDSEHLATFDDTDRRYWEELVKLFEHNA